MASKAKSFKSLAAILAALVSAQGTAVILAQSWPEPEAQSGRREQPLSNVSSSITGSLATSVPLNADAVLEEMSQAAGVIFAGEVTAIRRPVELAGSGAIEGIVEVDFRVDQTVRGATGPVYTLREWAGLWSAYGGDAWYRAGQRLLMFLYQPDSHGLSSTVHGRDGAVPLRGGGRAPGADDTTTSAGGWLVDLRWLQARALKSGSLVMLPVLRPIVPRPTPGMSPDAEETQGKPEAEPNLLRREPVEAPVATTASVETQSLTQVIALCRQALRRVDAGQ